MVVRSCNSYLEFTWSMHIITNIFLLSGVTEINQLCTGISYKGSSCQKYNLELLDIFLLETEWLFDLRFYKRLTSEWTRFPLSFANLRYKTTHKRRSKWFSGPTCYRDNNMGKTTFVLTLWQLFVLIIWMIFPSWKKRKHYWVILFFNENSDFCKVSTHWRYRF